MEAQLGRGFQDAPATLATSSSTHGRLQVRTGGETEAEGVKYRCFTLTGCGAIFLKGLSWHYCLYELLRRGLYSRARSLLSCRASRLLVVG